MRRWSWRSAAGLAALVAAGCSSDGADVACDPAEQLVEPGGSAHVIDPAAADYRHHPPASGPHFSGNPPEAGVHDEPVPEALQVSALEHGSMVINYDPDRVREEEVAELVAFAEGRDDVIVTPAAAPIDDGAAVAFTAWEHRRLCDGFSADQAGEFAEEFVDPARPDDPEGNM